MKIAVIIPCYNVAAHIESVVEKIPANIDWIIVVNDCSKDDTANIRRKLAKHSKRIIYLQHEKNQGVGAAMLTGYKKSMELKADISIKMDGDGQMDASYIPALIKPLLDDKADFTKGNRFHNLRALQRMPISRRLGNTGLSFIIKASSGYWNTFDPTNGFTAIKNETLMEMDLYRIHKRYYFETSMLIELYYRSAVVKDIPMHANYGEEISGLSRTRVFFEFPPKLLYAFIRRLLLKYFLYEFNVASIYLLTGLPMFCYGLAFGIKNYLKYTSIGLPAPTGTVIIPTLLIILGFQLLLSGVSYDIGNYPKK